VLIFDLKMLVECVGVLNGWKVLPRRDELSGIQLGNDWESWQVTPRRAGAGAQRQKGCSRIYTVQMRTRSCADSVTSELGYEGCVREVATSGE
jgi:hypothetical protein